MECDDANCDAIGIELCCLNCSFNFVFSCELTDDKLHSKDF